MLPFFVFFFISLEHILLFPLQVTIELLLQHKAINKEEVDFLCQIIHVNSKNEAIHLDAGILKLAYISLEPNHATQDKCGESPLLAEGHAKAGPDWLNKEVNFSRFR